MKRLNPDPSARIHVDKNASILAGDYIDELVEAGMTDIGPDLKGYYPKTFMRITGIEDRGLAERYLNTSWDAARYLIARYMEGVFTGMLDRNYGDREYKAFRAEREGLGLL